jgi:hypothetical protein
MSIECIFFLGNGNARLVRVCECLIQTSCSLSVALHFHLIHDGTVLKYFLNFLFERQDIPPEYSNYKGQRCNTAY